MGRRVEENKTRGLTIAWTHAVRKEKSRIPFRCTLNEMTTAGQTHSKLDAEEGIISHIQLY